MALSCEWEHVRQYYWALYLTPTGAPVGWIEQLPGGHFNATAGEEWTRHDSLDDAKAFVNATLQLKGRIEWLP